MEIKFLVKQVGKKHPLLKEQTINLGLQTEIVTLEILLKEIVSHQVAFYNSREVEAEDTDRTAHPQEQYLAVLMETGKAGFANIYNPQKADHVKAQENALKAFSDGIFAVFYGEEELTSLSDTINLSLNNTFTFIRLTFLAGSYW